MNLIELILTLSILTGQLIKFPIGVGGVTILDLAVFILTTWGLVNLRFKLKKPPMFVNGGFIFIILALISSVLTPLQLSLEEMITSLMYLVRFSSYLLLGWVITSQGFKYSLSPNLFIISGALLSIIGILQILIYPDLGFLQQSGWDPHFYRAVSTFLDPNFLGAFLVITLLLMLCHPEQREGSKQKFFLIFTIIYLTLLLTFSRSSYLMFFISTITLGLLQRSKKIILSSILLSAFLLVGFQVYTLTISEPRNIDRSKSASFRLNTWQQGITIFEKSPLLGIGYNSYRYALRDYNLGDSDFLNSHGASSNDSSILFILATTGIVGLIAFLLLLLFLMKTSFVVCSILAGLLAHSLFNNSLFYPPVLLSIILISTLKFSKR